MARDVKGGELHVRVVSRDLVKASDSSIEPHILAVSNLDLLPQTIQVSMFCIYPKPPAGDMDGVVAAFKAGLPSFLNHFFLLAGRIAANPVSGLPEVHCYNQGAELVVGDAGAVALAALDLGNVSASVRRVQQPYGHDMALSVQVVSFACGGFTVAWCTNHVLVDGSALSLLVRAWSELARTGTLSVGGSRPNHNRAVFRPRAPPSYDPSLNEAFTPLEGERQVNVLTRDQTVARRLYYIEASDVARLREEASPASTRVQAVSAYLWKTLASVVGTSDARCRMGWWVDGRRRLRLMHNYFGNVTAFASREASAAEVRRMPLREVAAMVREAAVAAPAYDEHYFQELVDWAEEHKTKRYVETQTLGLGSPMLAVTAFTSFQIDTDFGFGRAAMATPTTASAARLCVGLVQIAAQHGVDGPWIVTAFVWPQLAAALEASEPRVFKPVTAEFLGLVAPKVQQQSRL